MYTLLLTCVLLTAPGNHEGKVVRTADGDTITVLVDRQQVRVRPTPLAQQRQQIPSSSCTSPVGGSFLPDGGGVDYTSPDGGSFLPAGQTQAVQQKPISRYQQAKRQRQDLKIKANQLRQAGRTSGTFVQGELQR